MAQLLNGGQPIVVGDAYTTACTLGPAPGVSVIRLSVLSKAAVVVQCWSYVDAAEAGDYRLEPQERTIPGQSIDVKFRNCAGIQIKNATPGSPATVLGDLAYENRDVEIEGAGVTGATIDTSANSTGASTTVTAITAPGAGTFVLPTSAKKVTVVCVGAGGGGGGGGKSGAVGTFAEGGCGGGGGATVIQTYDGPTLLARFPLGVPYVVGAGGAGGAGGAAPAAGGDGGGTGFGQDNQGRYQQVAGGGGGGPAPSPNVGTSGSGGGLSNAAGSNPAVPATAGFNSPGFGPQGQRGFSQALTVQPVEYGGGAGGSAQVGNIGGASQGYAGGASLWGGPGGGGGGGFVGTVSAVNQQGGFGGDNNYVAPSVTTGGADGGTRAPMRSEYAGAAGNGGAGANTSGSKPNGTAGGAGGIGAGGGGGGAAGTGVAGAGGKGGDGQIVVIVQ